MATKTTLKPRGFQCMGPRKLRKVCASGGTSTAKKYGRRYMAEIGRNGRNKRTLAEMSAVR